MDRAEYFRGKKCIVTGAASGIGFAMSEALLNAGATVVLADCDTSMLVAAAGQLSKHAERVSSVTTDVTDEAQVDRLIEAASSQGRLDMIFNNAGVGGALPIGDATIEQWRRLVDVNLWGVVHGVRAALPVMRRQRSGHIVNTSSIGGLMPLPFQSLYNTTKYAVVGLSETLRIELSAEGIAVSVACPGAVATPIWGKPIIGAAVDVKPPADAMPVDEAARLILDGVATRAGIIVLPEKARDVWRQYCQDPESIEPLLQEMAGQRRSMFRQEGAAAWAGDKPYLK